MRASSAALACAMASSSQEPKKPVPPVTSRRAPRSARHAGSARSSAWRRSPAGKGRIVVMLESFAIFPMKLAICIPTHHGRAGTLRQLLDSLLRQRDLPAQARVELCISDNASADGTAELVREYQPRSPFPLKYFRFERDMRGVRNFLNVVSMTESDWCWLVGSDDVLVEGGLAQALRALEGHPEARAATVNKLNFDHTLE